MKFLTRTFAALAAALLTSLVSPVALAAENSVADAEKMIDSALAHIKSVGTEAASKDFMSDAAKWRRGNMYIVLVQFDGTMLAHSAVPRIAGKNMLEAKDAAGKQFVAETVSNVKAKGASQIDIRWQNPETKKIDDGMIVARRVPGAEQYLGAVFFK